MLIKPARMNRNGVNAIVSFAEAPRRLGFDPPSLDQRYVPGISVPGVRGLNRPFNVPIVGDGEPFSITIDWPCLPEAPHNKRITVVGVIPAETVTVGKPKNRDLRALEDDSAREVEITDEHFDDYVGEWGGFLRAAVSLGYVETEAGFKLQKRGEAEFILWEDVEEWGDSYSMLKQGVTPIEIVSAVKAPYVAPLLGQKAVGAA